VTTPNAGDPAEVERARSELLSLTEAAVDASSMIYMLKAGFFGYAAAEVRLFTVGPVAGEVGWPELPVRIVDLRRGGEVPWTADTVEIAEAYVDNADRPNDELLLELARRRSLAVVSEDLAVLESAAGHGLAHFNALMLLALLALRGRIEAPDYEEYFALLRSIGRYRGDVLDFARAVARRGPGGLI
jgi:predicted nucleic acid-binding protein